MSITIVVLVSTLMAVLIGAKIYFEHKQEEALEQAKREEDAFADLQSFIINPTEFPGAIKDQPVAIEQPIEEQPKADTPEPVEIQDINSAAALAEVKPKPKKKRRYYGKPKPKAKQVKKA